MRKKLVEDATGLVVNVFTIESGTSYSAPPGHTMSVAGNAAPGDSIVNGKLVKVAPVLGPTDEDRVAAWLDKEPFLKALISAMNKATDDPDHLALNAGLTDAGIIAKIVANLPKPEA